MIQNRLNNRPRKRLGFRTPAEVFDESLNRVALRAESLWSLALLYFTAGSFVVVSCPFTEPVITAHSSILSL